MVIRVIPGVTGTMASSAFLAVEIKAMAVLSNFVVAGYEKRRARIDRLA
jgi:precorrin-4 methylase